MHRTSIEIESLSHLAPLPAASKVGTLLESSITTPFNPGTRDLPETFEAQAENLFVHMGQMLGAAGGVEAIFSVLAIRDNVLPPTINLENPDPDCDLDYVPNDAREATVDTVVSNSFGFGGTNGSLVFRAFD